METQRIKEILEKYWAGETTLDEESLLKTYFQKDNIDEELVQFAPLFVYYADHKEVSYDKDIESILSSSQAKIFTIGRMRAIAASIILVAACVFGFNYFQKADSQTKVDTLSEEVSDPDEAYALTIEALAYLSKNYDKGSAELSKLSEAMNSSIIFK